MSKIHIWENGVTTERDATTDEQTAIDAIETEFNSNATKLVRIKVIREEKLNETDWWVLKGNITTEQSDYRQALRDIPQNNTTKEQYDLLLARDEDGQLTHEIWSKP